MNEIECDNEKCKIDLYFIINLILKLFYCYLNLD